jgi:hypothetical protein
VYKLSLLPSPWKPWGGGNCITTPWNWFYENWRLECVLNGRTLLTAVPPARVTRLSGIPWWQDGVLERHWESASRRPKPAQEDLPWSKKKVLGDLHGGPLRGHLGVDKTLNTATRGERRWEVVPTVRHLRSKTRPQTWRGACCTSITLVHHPKGLSATL